MIVVVEDIEFLCRVYSSTAGAPRRIKTCVENVHDGSQRSIALQTRDRYGRTGRTRSG